MHPMTSLPQKQCHLMVGQTLVHTLSKFEVNWTHGSWDINTFILPLFSKSDHYQPCTWAAPETIASEPTPQQLITQSAQATADAIASALAARTASISPVCLWLEFPGCLPLLLHILPYPGEPGSSSTAFCKIARTTSGTSLQPWEPSPWRCNAQWMPTGSEEEQKVTRVKASAFLNRIQ